MAIQGMPAPSNLPTGVVTIQTVTSAGARSISLNSGQVWPRGNPQAGSN